MYNIEEMSQNNRNDRFDLNSSKGYGGNIDE